MLKGERKGFRLYVHFRSNFEYRLETDTLLAYIALSVRLRTLRCATYSFDVGFIKAIFIGVDDYSRRMERENQERVLFRRCCFGVLIVFCVLYQFIYETSLCRVEVCGKPVKTPIS